VIRKHNVRLGPWLRRLAPYAVGGVSVATLTAVAFYLEVHSTTAALLYLIVIVLMALRTGAAPSAVTAMLAYLGLDSFFTAPLFRPAMNQPLDVVAPIVFLTTAFTINRLAAKNRQSFQEIQALQDQLRLVMDTIPGLVWSELPNGSVEFLNQRWRDFLGASSTPVTDLRRNLPVHPAEADSLAEQWQQARMRGQAFETEVRVRRADGVYRRLRLHVVPAGEPGQVIKWYGLGTDIEDWRQAEESLAKLQSELALVSRRTLLGELAASIAHEINQPLAAIVTNGNACLRWLGAVPPNLPEARTTVMAIIRDGNRAAEIIARIRAMLSRTELKKATFDLGAALVEVLSLIRNDLVRKGITIHTHLSPGIPAVFGDRVQCQQVVLNLLVNAVEALLPVTERRREIRLSAEPYGNGQVLVTVEDNGVGLGETHGANIFDAFYTTKPDGMGLGLAISRSIVENHGGRLWCVAGDSFGAKFQFTLMTEGSVGDGFANRVRG